MHILASQFQKFGYIYANWVTQHKSPRKKTAMPILDLLITKASLPPDLNDPEFQRSLINAIYEVSPNGILVVDARGTVVFHNPRFFEVWQLPVANKTNQFIGTADSSVLSAVIERVKNPQKFLARIEELYANPDLEDDCEIELNNGRTLDRHSTALRGHQGQYLGRVWFFRDITSRKQAENILRESENRFRQMFELNDAVMLLIDPGSGAIVDANAAASRFYGYAVECMRTMTINEINSLPPEKIAEERARSLRQERNYFVFPHRLANGEIRTVEVHSSPIRVGDDTLLFSIIHDITRQHQAEQELRIAAIAFESQEGVFVTDADQVILRVNRAFTDITGYTAEDVVGKSPHMLSSGRHDEAFYAAIWESIMTRGTWQGEIWNRRKSGQIYPEWLTITAVKDENGEVTHYVAALMDISLRKASEEEISQLAFYDVLTRLPNRRMLLDRFGRAMAASKRSRKQGAIMFLDLDNFKSLNDTYGHIAGDMLLIEAAHRIARCVRETDTVSRFGGDEFVVLLTDLDTDLAASREQALLVAEKIRAALAAPYLLTLAAANTTTPATIEHHCTVSIGLGLFSGRIDMEDILAKADTAMYQAKHDGCNRIRMYEAQS
jgi:diguanylate cyclase (GGDEF)-like protein/PAS domain S-box-containing protein